jgi:UDP-N-acetylglucosamine--N-acetylmuramyl-(pentapeptide) pyrophosphoryl-undecaprenol N-acetylglucosamine transferase
MDGMQEIRRILLTGGGTAGHVNPALAIGSALDSGNTRFLFVGVRGRVEEQVVPREGMPIKYVRASGFPGTLSPALLPFLANLSIGILQSLWILCRFRPDVIVGTGGYVSAPIVMAAAVLRKLRLSHARVFIHEQNAVPGKLNQLMGRFADRILVTFPETLSFFPAKAALAGYPLRRRIAAVGREEALKKIDFPIPENRKVVLVFGGSQGSRTINRALVDALRHLLPFRDRLFIIHGTGLMKSRQYDAAADTEARLRRLYDGEELGQIESFYLHRPYFYNIENLYAASDLVIARAGAGSLNEISAMGLPALIIPKSNLPGNHQVMNARSMERAGGAEILYEQIAPVDGRLDEWLDGRALAEAISSLALDDERLERLRHRSREFLNRDALGRIARIIRAEDAGATEAAPGAPLPGIGPEEERLPGNRALLLMLEKAERSRPHLYHPETVVGRPQDLEFYKNRASALLIHPSWPERNLGVKLLGLLHAREKAPALVTLLRERKPASLLKRCMGGDFEQVGFIRRNIVTALVRMDALDDGIEAALLEALGDPYYEVQAEAARAAAHFGSRLSSGERFVCALLENLKDRNLDVGTAAAEALGVIGGERDALPALLRLWDTRFWKMRAAALRGLYLLVERGEVSDPETLETEIPRFILTSTDFRPHFEIKSTYRRLMESLSRTREKGLRP